MLTSWLLILLFYEIDLKKNRKPIIKNYQATRCLWHPYPDSFIYIAPFLLSKIDLTSKDLCWDRVLFFIYLLFLYNSLTCCKAQYWTLIFLLMASGHLIQKADIADGRAGSLRSWVLRTCYGAKSHSRNRAPQSVGHPPRHSHILMLGDDDSMRLDQQHAKDSIIFIFTFAHTSPFIHFLSVFSLMAFASTVIDARVCVQPHIYRTPSECMYIRCLPTCWMGQAFFLALFSVSVSTLLEDLGPPKAVSHNFVIYTLSFYFLHSWGNMALLLRYCHLNQWILLRCILANSRFLILTLSSSPFPFPWLFFLVIPCIPILIRLDCNNQTSSTSIFDSRSLQFSSQTRISFSIYICYQQRLPHILHAFPLLYLPCLPWQDDPVHRTSRKSNSLPHCLHQFPGHD